MYVQAGIENVKSDLLPATLSPKSFMDLDILGRAGIEYVLASTVELLE